MRNTKAVTKTGLFARTRALSVMMVIVMMIGCLSGCARKTDVNDEFNDGTEVLFDLGDSEISYGKMLYFISYYEMYGQYMANYYRQYLNYDGTYWDEIVDEESGTTEAEYFKKLSYDTAVYYEIFKNAAVAAGLTLNDAEIAQCSEDALSSISVFTDEQLKKSGITREGLLAAQKTITLASKFIEQIRSECMASDEYALTKEGIVKSDYLAYKTECIFFGPAEGETDMSTAKARAEEAAALIGSETNFNDLAATYTEDTVSVKALNRTFTPADQTLETAYISACAELANGAVSSMVETVNGYYYIRMLDRSDESIYDTAVEDSLSAFVDSYVSAAYDTLSSAVEVKEVGNKWSKLKMGTVTLTD